nr:thioesterase family protein [Syntrophobotulus glycolicus]
MINMEIGAKGKSETVVTEKVTAKTLGSGTLDVLATPIMVAIMENAATRALDLPEGQTSVGTYLEIKHLAATPVGMKVWAVAEITGIEGRKLSFKIEAYDEKEKIGEGEHERFIINAEKFLEKAYAKLS